MNLILAKMILVGCGVAICQDGVASVWHYWKREHLGNQTFRAVRIAVGVAVIIVAVRLEL